jgi:ribosomal protein S18 acetylase RimI-like enzyme
LLAKEEIAHDLSPAALVNVIEANTFSFFPLWRRWPKAEVHDDPELLWTLTSIPSPFFNSIFRARLAPEAVDAAITAVIDRGRVRNVPLMWWTGPATQPADLSKHLTARGFVGEELPGMAADLRALPDTIPAPSGLVIERVKDLGALRTWCDVMCTSFELPSLFAEGWHDSWRSLGLSPRAPYRQYLGWLEGEPVATSAVVFGAGVAGIYNVGTLPAVRRQGIGTALTLVPLLEARAMGYRIAILHSSDMAIGAYRQLGFKRYCRIGQYVWANEQ